MAMATTTSILQQSRFIPVQLLTEHEIITRSRQGVLRAEADRVANLVGLTDKEMAATLGISANLYQRVASDFRVFTQNRVCFEKPHSYSVTVRKNVRLQPEPSKT